MNYLTSACSRNYTERAYERLKTVSQAFYWRQAADGPYGQLVDKGARYRQWARNMLAIGRVF